MSAPNRLLDMLKAATSPPPPPPPPSHLQPFNNTQPHPNLLSSPDTGGSPREPSPSPPPPSLQAVSLHNLFSSLSSGPPPPAQFAQPTGPAGPAGPTSGPTSSVKEEPHQAKLLGMLKALGNNPVETPSASRERQMSGTQSPVGVIGSGMSTPGSTGDGHKQNLLNMFKSSPNAFSASRQPVIGHPTGPESASRPSSTSTASPSSPNTTQLPFEHAHVQVPAQPPSTQVAAPPKKSMFDFVSPFDVFEKTKPASPARSVDNTERESTKPVAGNTVTLDGVSAASPGIISPPKRLTPLPKAKQLPTPPIVDDARPRQLSTASSQVTGGSGKDAGLPWLVNKVVEKGTEGKGWAPKATASQFTVDLSKPNIDSLVNAPGEVQIVPVTILKTDKIGFTNGRNVGMTTTWLAYALSKGRIRLIDRASGSKLVLHLPSGSASGSIVDMAVASTSVAVVGSDRSVTVFKVPMTWERDDPPCEMAVHVDNVGSIQEDERTMGDVFRVEWVKKDDRDWLAVGCEQGVVLFEPEKVRDERDLSVEHLAKRFKVLKTEGPLASFCLNHTHQAIALLSIKSDLTLYNVSSLARVWNRPLPPSATPQSGPASPPTSVQFCESNVLIGRANNTLFDLVQITVEVAVLSSIYFTAPQPCPPNLHFGQAGYDSTRNILWIAPFARGSVYGFRYALKGAQPVKISEQGSGVVAFDKMAEYPIEPVLSLVLGQSPISQDAELFFATRGGFSQAHITKAACEVLNTPLTSSDASKSVESARSATNEPVKKTARATGPAATPSKPSKNASPSVTKTELVSEGEDGFKGGQVGSSTTSGLASAEEINKILKRSEDKIANNFKQQLTNQLTQVNTRLDSLSPGDLAADTAARVERQIKANLGAVVQTEIKRAVVPALQSTIQTEVRNAVSAAVPLAITAALQNVSRDLEKGIVPGIQRAVTSVVQHHVERALQEALHTSLLPAMTSAGGRLADQLSAEFKSEMVQIRKDFSPPDPAYGTEALIESLSTSIADLQKQVTALSDQVARSSLPSTNLGPAPATLPVPMMTGANGGGGGFPPPVPHAQHPPPPPPPPVAHLEDTFLSAMGAQSTPATLGLINDYWNMTETVLPIPPQRGPLSQAVMLTLLHRISLSLSELSPSDPNFQKLVTWERRVATILDPRHPDIAAFYTRVVPVVQGILGNVVQSMNSRYGGDPAAGEAGRFIRQILEVLGQK